MTYRKYELTCKSGGFGWGKTGARRFMCAPGTTEAEAKAYIELHIPGGWSFRLIGKTNDSYFLTSSDH